MGNQFCTSCGHAAAMDAKFCENCGAIFRSSGAEHFEEPIVTAQESPAHVATNRDALITQARGVVSAWVAPFNASLVFGSTLVAVFDFLSPRIALLPIAATVAVVGLLASLALRKFVAPSLPESSAFRRALAPEMKLHKSPILIATGLLSALMVSGAAWSNVSATEGGIIASKFDAVRNAQMQLGIMQSMQKEQRVQTAVLEDIREGRTNNPRRELANQGILWNNDRFSDAIDSSDISVIQLFLIGGMHWRLSQLESVLRRGDQKIMSLFLQNPLLLDLDDERDCWKSIYLVTDGKLNTFRKRQLKYDPPPAPILTSIDKGFLKLFCPSTKDVAMLNRQIRERSESYQSEVRERIAMKSSAGISSAPGTRRSSAECTRDLLANNAKKLIDRAHSFVPVGDCGFSGCTHHQGSDRLLSKIKEKNPRSSGVLSADSILDIKEYCDSDWGQDSPFDDFDIQIFKQIANALT